MLRVNNVNQTNIPPILFRALVDVWGKSDKLLTIPIVGNSMYPLMKGGDQVFVECMYKHIRCGEILAFKLNDTIIVHRVLKVCKTTKGLSLTTKGDNVPGFDPVIYQDNILGKVKFIKRGKRNLTLDSYTCRVMGRLIPNSTLLLNKFFSFNKDNRLYRGVYYRGLRFIYMNIRRIVFYSLCKWKLIQYPDS